MPPINVALALFLLGFGVSASEKIHLTEHSARSSSRDTKVPRALVKRMEEDYRIFLTTNKPIAKVEIRRKLLDLSVELTQKSNSALHENARVVTPTGGGVIDLSELVTPLRGAFWLKIVVRKDKDAESEPANLRVFFVSNAKQRTLEGEEFGAGCGKFMEITSIFKKKNGAKDKGFELYTSDQRYLSVMGGTLVAFVFEDEALFVGSITFTDSRYPDLLCE